MLRRLFFVLGFTAVIAAAFFFLRTPDTKREEMVAKYGGEAPLFAGPDDFRVHYRDQGCRTCPAIVLLHGSFSSLHTWEPLVSQLGAEYRLISLDLPGHGLTGPHPNDDYSAYGNFEAIDIVIAATGAENFTLAGNSMGGWLTWRYALAHPDRVDALILIDASGAPLRDGETPPPLNLGFRLMRSKIAKPIIENFTPRKMIKKSVILSVADPSFATDEVVDRHWELLRFPGNRRASAIRAHTDRENAYADKLSDITAPTLILWGSEDQLIYASAAQTFSERIPNSEAVVFDGVGHIPMEEAPAKTANAIRRFMEQQAPAVEDRLQLEGSQ